MGNRTRPVARGLHSNVTVNLKASEAVALWDVLDGSFVANPDARAALDKVKAAADRARVPWRER